MIERFEPLDPRSATGALATAKPDLVQALSDQAGALSHDIRRAAQDVTLTVARATYTGAYFIAYAAVVCSVLLVRSIPKENPVVRGLEDGGRAASDALADEQNRPTK